MPTLTMLIGLSGSGKSTYANAKKIKVHSSDTLRQELYGNVNHQLNNRELFEELHKRIKSDLDKGLDVVYDATNLVRKRRSAFVSSLKKKVEVHFVVIATPLFECINRDRDRGRSVGKDVIMKQAKSFQFPLESEGYDDINVVFTCEREADYESQLMSQAKTFDQDNPHHSLSLGDHLLKTSKLVLKSTTKRGRTPIEMCMAGLFHDIGKLYTKTYFNYKGEPTTYAHYYGHENVSAYVILFVFQDRFNVDDDMLFHIVRLINYHMLPHFIETPKARKKWAGILGDQLWEDVNILHKCDKEAH